jgi:hypothetical protein
MTEKYYTERSQALLDAAQKLQFLPCETMQGKMKIARIMHYLADENWALCMAWNAWIVTQPRQPLDARSEHLWRTCGND